VIKLRSQDDEANDAIVLHRHPGVAGQDCRGIVGGHRGRRAADPADVAPVGREGDGAKRGTVGGISAPDRDHKPSVSRVIGC